MALPLPPEDPGAEFLRALQRLEETLATQTPEPRRIYITALPPEIVTMEEWLLERVWAEVRIVDEGGWIKR